jgi:transcriptional regulator with XRE-family HTH domain
MVEEKSKEKPKKELSLFAQRLKNARTSKQFTQKEVAEFLNIEETSYQHYEYGKREPSYKILVRLCNHLDVSSDYLLGLSNDSSRK